MLSIFQLTKDGYFYTYSALAQSAAALLGILGVFVVYRLPRCSIIGYRRFVLAYVTF